MNSSTLINPSEAGRKLLEALEQSVAKALERKQRLGQYVVTWKNGRPLLTGDDAPQADRPAEITP